jgi:hypothetical protein
MCSVDDISMKDVIGVQLHVKTAPNLPKSPAQQEAFGLFIQDKIPLVRGWNPVSADKFDLS